MTQHEPVIHTDHTNLHTEYNTQ